MFEKPQHMLSCYAAPRFEEYESLLSSSIIPENWQDIKKQTLSHLNGNLEAIETSCLRNLDFLAKTLNQVFIHNAITGSEESKNMLDEVPFIILTHTGNKKHT